jgi:uncharacterized protein with GYD domain
MLQFSYTPEAWEALSRNPANRFEAVRALLEQFGGRLTAAFYSFGEYDGVILAELPDNVSSAAVALAANAAGHNKAVKTTVLLTVEEALEAMRRSGRVDYEPPEPPGPEAFDDPLDREAVARADAEGMAVVSSPPPGAT